MKELNDFYARRLAEILTSSNEHGGFVFNIGMNSVETTRTAIDSISEKIRGNALLGEWKPVGKLEDVICERCMKKIEACLNDSRCARRYDEAHVTHLGLVEAAFRTCSSMSAKQYDSSNVLNYTNAKLEHPDSLKKAINDFHNQVLESGEKFLMILNMDSKEQLENLHNIEYLANNDNIVLLVNVVLRSVYFDALVKSIDCYYGVSKYENANDFLRQLALADRIFYAEQGG